MVNPLPGGPARPAPLALSLPGALLRGSRSGRLARGRPRHWRRRPRRSALRPTPSRPAPSPALLAALCGSPAAAAEPRSGRRGQGSALGARGDVRLGGPAAARHGRSDRRGAVTPRGRPSRARRAGRSPSRSPLGASRALQRAGGTMKKFSNAQVGGRRRRRSGEVAGPAGPEPASSSVGSGCSGRPLPRSPWRSRWPKVRAPGRLGQAPE